MINCGAGAARMCSIATSGPHSACLDGRNLPKEVLHLLVVALARRWRRGPRLKVAAAAGAVGAALQQERQCTFRLGADKIAVGPCFTCTAQLPARRRGRAASEPAAACRRHCLPPVAAANSRCRPHRAPVLTATVPSRSFMAAGGRPCPQAALRAAEEAGQEGAPGCGDLYTRRSMWAMAGRGSGRVRRAGSDAEHPNQGFSSCCGSRERRSRCSDRGHQRLARWGGRELPLSTCAFADLARAGPP